MPMRELPRLCKWVHLFLCDALKAPEDVPAHWGKLPIIPHIALGYLSLLIPWIHDSTTTYSPPTAPPPPSPLHVRHRKSRAPRL